MNPSRLVQAALLSLFASITGVHADQPGTSPVKIFILSGQSNMLGQGNMNPVTTQGTLDYVVANDPGGKYQFLKDGGGAWVERDDVWITDQNGKRGGITVGYGSSATTVGPELGFGHHMGDLYEEQVLIVKAAWGGKSLAVDFRPPSSGGTTGFYYNETLSLVNDAIANLGSYFPDYNVAGGYEIAGFIWHQGWNDRVTPAYSTDYQVNMANFIGDIRADLGVPGLPFVIATTGMDGGTTYSQVEQAQQAMAGAFPGSVAVVDTRITYDGMDFWQPVEFSPADQGYHWNRNSKTYLNIGLALADAMSTLSPGRCPSRLRASGGSGGVTLSWQNGSEMPSSVQIFRNSVEIAAAAPVSPAIFVDTGAAPGALSYELAFTMPGDPCDPLSVNLDGGITDLKAFRSPAGVSLTWSNNLSYTAIEVRRNGTLIEPSLSGLAETYTDTSPPGSGLVNYTVVPSNGNATPATVQINLAGPPAGNAVIYEPFDYAVGGLNLKSGNAEVGLEGTWYAKTTTLVTAGTLSYGSLPVGGAKLSDFSGGQNHFGGTRTIRAAALAERGLLNDGATLWFSMLVGYDTGGNVTNSRLGFALATNSFVNANFNYNISDDGMLAGSGIGLTLGRFGVNGRTVATHFRDATSGTGFAGNVFGTLGGTLYQTGEHGLIVGKIVWGAGSDTIELYQPGTDLVLPASPISTLTATVDQSTFDTITFARGDKVLLDEIRFGATYEDAIGMGGANGDYEIWAGNYPAADLSDRDFDTDGDGFTNGEERIWGLDPTDASSINPYAERLDASGAFRYTRRSPALTGLGYTVWTSTNLADWTKDVTASANQLPGTPDANGVETVAATLTAAPVDGKIFVRIQAAE